ncbi:PROC [Lepeophtheirus salmonis]|uniref:PROC n=1 Tax=Lepeophtheirus salmonis TaxID=72036 RepID=A0A7R8HDM2_LEPSM|nr:PROC [Lepeophtheirus salmonis]CAF3033236.1 PROC [Lepeophtheirus salmonis]
MIIGPYNVVLNLSDWLIATSSTYHKHHVISAASCIKQYENEILVVKTGSVDSEAFSTRYILYYINDKAYHPDYNSTTHENDVVILTAEFNMEPNINLIPICLPQVSTHNFTDTSATYTGVDIPTISTQTKLGFLITKIVNDNQCQSSNLLCAKAINTSSNGNWGSPLVAKVDGSCALIGIHSKQTEGDGILKFTRIDRYLDWIKPRILHYYIVYKEYSFWESVNDEINGNEG